MILSQTILHRIRQLLKNQSSGKVKCLNRLRKKNFMHNITQITSRKRSRKIKIKSPDRLRWVVCLEEVSQVIYHHVGIVISLYLHGDKNKHLTH
jgi:hypothetical protein